MTPEQFLTDIVTPNVRALSDEPDNVRLAINAILTLDAFIGVLFYGLSKRPLQGKDDNDDTWRATLSNDSDVRLVLDTARAIKHGELTRKAKNPPLVKRADQVIRSNTWDNGVWDQAVLDEPGVVLVCAEERIQRADLLAQSVLKFYQNKISLCASLQFTL